MTYGQLVAKIEALEEHDRRLFGDENKSDMDMYVKGDIDDIFDRLSELGKRNRFIECSPFAYDAGFRRFTNEDGEEWDGSLADGS